MDADRLKEMRARAEAIRFAYAARPPDSKDLAEYLAQFCPVLIATVVIADYPGNFPIWPA